MTTVSLRPLDPFDKSSLLSLIRYQDQLVRYGTLMDQVEDPINRYERQLNRYEENLQQTLEAFSPTSSSRGEEDEFREDYYDSIKLDTPRGF